MKKAFVSAIFFAIFLLVGSSFAQTIPAPLGPVNDFANILNAESKIRLHESLVAYEKSTTIEMVIVTIPSLEGYEIEEYTITLANKWGVGKKSNNGIVILIAPKERRWRIEVGYGLEGYLTDAVAKTIGEQNLVPSFKAGKYDEGIEKGVIAIQNKLGNVSWEIREAENERKNKEDEKTRKENTKTLLSVLGIAAILVIFIFIISRITKYFREKKMIKEEAQKSIQHAERYKKIRLEKSISLHTKGFKKANAVKTELEKIDTACLQNLFQQKQYEKITEKVFNIENKIDSVFHELNQDAENYETVRKAELSFPKNLEDAKANLQKALLSLATLKREAPQKVWEKHEGIETKMSALLEIAERELKEAFELGTMHRQEFWEAEKKVKDALFQLEAVNSRASEVIELEKSWEHAKKKGEEYLKDVSNEKKAKIIEKANEDGLMNWLLVLAMITSAHSSSSGSSDHHYKSHDSDHSSSNWSGGFGGGSFGGGSFGGGGASGGW